MAIRTALTRTTLCLLLVTAGACGDSEEDDDPGSANTIETTDGGQLSDQSVDEPTADLDAEDDDITDDPTLDQNLDVASDAAGDAQTDAVLDLEVGMDAEADLDAELEMGSDADSGPDLPPDLPSDTSPDLEDDAADTSDATDTSSDIPADLVDEEVTADVGVDATSDVWDMLDMLDTSDAGVTAAAVRPFYGAGETAQWGYYLLRDGSGWFDASGAVCTGEEAGFYSSCIHTGEMLAFDVPGLASCANVTAVDALGAFRWTCREDMGAATVVSTGLIGAAGLADLINFSDLSWLANSVEVFVSGESLVATESAPWHGTTIAAVPGVTLDQADTIYAVAADLVRSVSIEADGVSLVVAPGASFVGTVDTPIDSGQRFLWIEGRFDPSGGGFVIELNDVRFSVLRNVLADGSVELRGSSANRLQGVYAAYAGDPILIDTTSSHNLLEDVVVFMGSISAVRLNGHDNVLVRVVSVNSNVGTYLLGSRSDLLMGVTSIAHSSHGIWLNGAVDSTLHGLAVANTLRAINIQSTTGAQFHDVVFSDTWQNDSTSGFGAARDAGSTLSWSGLFWYSGHAFERECVEGIGYLACSSFAPSASRNAAVSLSTSFVGVVEDDPANLDDDANGQATDGVSLDHLTFDLPLRGWGLVGTFPSNALRGDCTDGDCQVWDWNLKVADTAARNVLASPVGDDALELSHTWTADSEGACGAVAGAAWGGADCTSSLLVHASELGQDGVGNDNLLCEAGETCVLLPNLGGYQGHGTLEEVTTTGGAGGDVTLLQFNQNGY